MYQYVQVCTGTYWYVLVCTGTECTSSAVVHQLPGHALVSAVHIDMHTSTYQYKLGCNPLYCLVQMYRILRGKP
jgi:hypothetical protein